MSEEERDQIEEDAQNFIKSCSAAINSLKKSGAFIFVSCFTKMPHVAIVLTFKQKDAERFLIIFLIVYLINSQRTYTKEG